MKRHICKTCGKKREKGRYEAFLMTSSPNLRAGLIYNHKFDVDLTDANFHYLCENCYFKFNVANKQCLIEELPDETIRCCICNQREHEESSKWWTVSIIKFKWRHETCVRKGISRIVISLDEFLSIVHSFGIVK